MDKAIRFIVRRVSVFFSTLTFKLFLFLNGFHVPNKMLIDGMPYIKISKNGSIYIGENFTLNSRKASNLVGITNRASFQILNNGKIVIGNKCGFTATVLSSRTMIKVGNFVKVGGNVRIFDHDYHSLNFLNRRHSETDALDVKSAPVIIEDDVFIGTNVIILKGTYVGARSIIGAGSVIFGLQIPNDSLVFGNPAKIIKSLN